MDAKNFTLESLDIAMWDTGWLTRHCPCGSFKVLDEWFERGYNALRIQWFPHWAAAGNDGIRQERFLRYRGNGMESRWRNPWTLCQERYERCCLAIAESWPKRRDELLAWLRERLKLGIPYGNTEEWRPILWGGRPLLTWDYVRKAGLHGAKPGAELGCHFNGSSNFPQPQFQGLWNDMAWHREVALILCGERSW